MYLTSKKSIAKVAVCVLVLGSSLTLVGCSKKKKKNTVIGAVVGGAAGAGIGGAAGGGAGAGIGAAVGAVTGGTLGNVFTDDDSEDEK